MVSVCFQLSGLPYIFKSYEYLLYLFRLCSHLCLLNLLEDSLQHHNTSNAFGSAMKFSSTILESALWVSIIYHKLYVRHSNGVQIKIKLVI